MRLTARLPNGARKAERVTGVPKAYLRWGAAVGNDSLFSGDLGVVVSIKSPARGFVNRGFRLMGLKTLFRA